jgi:chemotaxis protein MotB
MIVRKGWLGVVAAMAALGACSNSDEVIAAKERAITEKSAENEALKKRIADAEGTNLVTKKQLEMKQAELDRAKAETERRPAEAHDATAMEEPAPRSDLGESPASVVKINDPDIELDSKPNGEVVMRLNAKELFASGSADITPAGKKVLTKVAASLKKYPGFRVAVEGHTDDTPLKKTAARWKNNMNLSIARALAVRTQLGEYGVPESRMSIEGFGDTRPLVPNKDEGARARNRRVEIVLSKS